MNPERREAALQRLNASSSDTLVALLGIQYTDVGEDFVVATMPVDTRHKQPYGILHGGATAALAETVGSVASAIQLYGTDQTAVGLELAINHLRPVRDGQVSARAEAIHVGRTTHLWQIDVRDEDNRRVALAKLTMMVRPASSG